MAQDNTGISLSVSDPDNENQPEQWGDGGAADAEDYCSAELVHGDEVTGLLNLSQVSPSYQKFSPGTAGLYRPRTHAGRNYLLLFGVFVVAVAGLVYISR